MQFLSVSLSAKCEEKEPILPGRETKYFSSHFIVKIFYTVSIVALITTLLLFTFHNYSSENSSVGTKPYNVKCKDDIDNRTRGKLNHSFDFDGKKSSLKKNNKGSNSTELVVEILSGRIRGISLKSRDGRDYFAFYGIPYAEPPIGNLRFQPPKPYKAKWSGIRDGTQRGGKETHCIQISKTSGASGTEDCLKLQVFTPKLPQRKRSNLKLPVMFYILGGAWMFGKANRYGADYIMDEDVVLVLIDYRVGALGYLNTEDLEIRGNMGFKDQVMALRWVQDNIEKFGGDPKKVLIFGNSSGGSDAHSHIISSMSDNLFSRAISQSGTINLPQAKLVKPIETAKLLGRKLKCPNVENTRELRKCLVKADAFEIASTPILMSFITKEAIPNNGDLSQVFMADDPMNLLKQGKFKKDIPWILGDNSAENYIAAHELIRRPPLLRLLDKTWNSLAPVLFGFEDDKKTHKAAKSLRKFYFDSKLINGDARYNLTNIFSDIGWIHPVKVSGDYHSMFGGSAYFYYLTHEPELSYGEVFKTGFLPPYGVSHADEVQFLFPYDKFPFLTKESKDYNFSKTMIKVWTDFARTGVPKVPKLKEWPPLPMYERNAPSARWLEFNDISQLMDPLRERMIFLDSFPFKDPEYSGAEIIATENAVLDFLAHLKDQLH